MINFIKDWDSTGIMIGEDGHTLSRRRDVIWSPRDQCISARCKVPFSQEHPKFEVMIMNIARAGKSQHTHTQRYTHARTPTHAHAHAHAHAYTHTHTYIHTHTHAHTHTHTHTRTHTHSLTHSYLQSICRTIPDISTSYNDSHSQ